MQAAEAQQHAVGRENILDPERDDGRAGVERRRDLVEDVGRGVRRRRENQDEEFCLADRLDDRGGPVPAVADIARRDPAADARFLQPVADGIGRCLVGDGVADEDVVGQAAVSCEPERSRPEGIECQNSAKAKAIHRMPGQLPMSWIARKSWVPGIGAHLPASFTFDTSQSLMIQSPLPEASVRPSGEYAAEKTAP
jgi:hypothetical protein